MDKINSVLQICNIIIFLVDQHLFIFDFAIKFRTHVLKFKINSEERLEYACFSVSGYYVPLK